MNCAFCAQPIAADHDRCSFCAAPVPGEAAPPPTGGSATGGSATGESPTGGSAIDGLPTGWLDAAAPPAASSLPPLPPPWQPDPPKPLGALGVAAVGALGATIAIDAVTIAIQAHRSRLLDRAATGPDSASVSNIATTDLFAALWSIADFACFVLTGVLFIVWLFRARVNAEGYFDRGREQRRDRGWAIGAWFCPVVNLWFPKQMVDDIWLASEPRRSDGASRQKKPTLVIAWWTAWLGANIATGVSTTIRREPKTIGDLAAASDALIVASVIDVVAAGLAILVVRRITAFQQERAGALAPLNPPIPVSTGF